jgi:septal ring factor EnvC (AmiA/AmiB activator)
MAPKIDDRIAGLESRLKQLKAEQARIDARKRTIAAKRSRQEDTRRKILAGTVVLQRAAADPTLQAQLTSWLEGYITRPEDRALFQLSPS